MSVLNQEVIIEYLKKHKDEYNKKYSIDKIGIFGSYANENNTSNSDIDIVYETSKNDLTLSQVFTLEDELKNYFHKEIDLVNLKYMNPFIKRKAIKDMIYV